MTKKQMRAFVRERDAALLSLDKDKITAFCKKYSVNVPQDETVFWAGVHKAIYHMNAATFEQKLRSWEWLVGHRFSPSVQ